MKNKIDLVNDCFSMLLRTGVTVNASPDDNVLALNRLEDMMAELESRNLATGYNFEDSPEPDSPSGLENWMNLAISQMLAMRVWPDFSPEEVNPMLARNSAQSSANLSARLAQQNALKYARRTPLGSGNQPYQQYNKFFGDYGSTCGPSDSGSASYAPVPTPPPLQCSCDVIPLSHLKLLGDEALFGASEKQYSITGFYDGSTVGGGLFVFNPDGDKSTHNGVTVYAPEALQAWAGTQADIATLLNWAGVGSGVWVRADLQGFVTPEMAGAVGDGVAINSGSIQAAVSYCFISGAQALWMYGVYLINVSIDNFHNVNHAGFGEIRNGSSSFYITPKSAQTNTIYVATTGSDENDGLFASQPFASIAAAMSVISAKRLPTTAGRWVINIAAGTYSGGALLARHHPENYRLVIQGPSVPLNSEPTAIIDGSELVTTNGLFFENCGDIEVKDIKFTNFSSGATTAGVQAAATRILRLRNIHVNGGGDGAGYYMRNGTSYQVTGGKVENCKYGVIELFSVVRDYKTVSSLSDGFTTRNNTYGLFAKELCTGHFDWSTVAENNYGIFFSRNCTANASDSKIQLNNYGAVLRGASQLVNLRIDWGFGTANENGVTWLIDNTSGFVINENTAGSIASKSQGEKLISSVCPESPSVLTGTTTPTTLASLGEMQAGTLVSEGEYVRVMVLGQKTGSSGTATIDIRVGNSTGPNVIVPASASFFRIEAWLISQGKDKQRVFAVVDGKGASDDVGTGVRTYSLSNTPLALSVRGTLGSASDSITIFSAQAYTTDIVGPIE